MTRRGLQAIAAVLFVASAAVADDRLAPGTTLCLFQVRVPLVEKSGEERRLAIERKLTAALRDADFRVPDPTAVEESRDRVVEAFGPVIDTATGERIQERYLARRARVAEALTAAFDCDAFVVASVTTVRASFVAGTAAWDGVKQRVNSTGRDILNALGGVYETGWVGALSLWIRVLDLDEQEIAFRSAGIETPLQRAVLRDEDLVPEDLWLTNSAAIDAAIELALGSDGRLLRNRGTPERLDEGGGE